MQSDRGVIFRFYFKNKVARAFIISIIVFIAVTPNLLAQPDSATNETDAEPQQPTVDSHPVESVSPPVEKQPDRAPQPTADDSSKDTPTNASDQKAPVDFGVLDAPELKTTVSATPPRQTKVIELTAAKEDKAQDDKPRDDAPKARRDDAPKARIGIQGSVWTSLSVPFGKFDGDRNISYIRGLGNSEVVLIGYKILPEFLVGLQIDILRSARGSVLDEVCEDEDSLCISSGIGIGVQAQVHLLPDRFVNPWIGYGIGISYLSATNGLFVGDISFSAPSFNFAQISTGADFRLNRAFGLGPFIRFGAGFFFHQIESEKREMDDKAIEDQALHFQLDIGVRFVFTP